MLVLDGCVQPGLAPAINPAAARLLDALEISLVREPSAGCCGAIAYHLADHAGGLNCMRRNIDAWWPRLDQGAEAIVITASGCGAMVREYGYLLRNEAAYAEKASRVSALARDVSEIVFSEKAKFTNLLQSSTARRNAHKVAFHSPCTLQHALRIRGVVEELLTLAGAVLTDVPDSHLCCGSAGTYSILQAALSRRLLSGKVAALESGRPEAIVTANIGCLTHIQSATVLPVMHWVELVANQLP
jgi:glycolate oxidase iron-sulfur subunit